MARREVFAGNWKMYKNYAEAVNLAMGLLAGVGDMGKREVVIFPPSVYLRELSRLCEKTQISTGAQNAYFEKEGAFTGEISPWMVKDCGARYLLIGHSERRHLLHETDEMVNKKVHASFEAGLEPMICVGELLEEREKSLTDIVVKRQVHEALKGVTPEQMKKVVIAYEPVWAIGTGKVATTDIAQEVHSKIRDIISSLYSAEIADIVPILYGGSVKPDNIKGLYSMEDIDGCLVGGASLKTESFLEISHVK